MFIASQLADMGQALSKVPIIAVTANTGLEDKANCRNAGMNAFLEKPLLRVDLIRALRELSPDNPFLKET